MKIVKNLILDVSIDFESLKTEVNGCNYVVWFSAKAFIYKDENIFEEKDLLEIFENDKNISGKIEIVNLDEAISYINNCLKYTSYDKGFKESNEPLNVLSLDDHKKRVNFFWNIINKYISLKSAKVFKHEADYNSYFGDYVMWGFCYIFINNGKGLVVHAGASD